MGENFQKSELPTLLQFVRVRVACQPHVLRKQRKNDSTNTFQRIPVLTSWGSQIPRQSQHNLMANQDLCQMSGLDLRYKLHGRLDHTVE